MIERPDVAYDDAKHRYTLEGKELLGVSTVAKIGEDAWMPASWWGFRVGYEGAITAMAEYEWDRQFTAEDMRAELKARKLTPNAKRDKRGVEGTWVHDVLELLAQEGKVYDLNRFPEAVRGHVTGLLRWYLDYRPSFVATEVQVVSEQHGFAGRYDIRCRIPETVQLLDAWGHTEERWSLALVDLKTTKRVYPEKHFPQLAGYELASQEMGFPPTDGQYVLRTSEDGSYEFVRSPAGPEHFLAYLAAEKAKRDVEAKAKGKK